MKKNQYIHPKVEVVCFNTDELMQISGGPSAHAHAPKRRTTEVF